MEENVRPWGRYDILYDGDDCKVKRITVKPGKRLSYQYHFKREEVWQIVSGRGTVTLNEVDMNVSAGSLLQIDKEERHRIANIGDVPLVFIEIQTGTYFGEDDIVRLEDDYGRK